MTLLAIALVLGAAFVHATWNFLAKRTGSGTVFVWLFAALSAALYAPVAATVLMLKQPHIGRVELTFMAGSGVLHLTYFVMLQRGYRFGDLSLVYPLARSTGPMLATAAAIAFFGERPTALALLGAALIVLGAFAISWNGGNVTARVRTGLAYGVLVGALIASYALLDKYAVSSLAIPPVLLDWSANLGRATLLTPYALTRWDRVQVEWRTHRSEALAIAALTPLSYILVLTAMSFTPVSYIAPAREISILIGTFLGTRWLGEGHSRQRLLAGGVMMLGLVALALG